MGVMPDGGCNETEEWISGVVSDHCPVMDVQEHQLLFDAYIWARRGVFPSGDGGWLNQPARLLRSIGIIWEVDMEEEARRIRASTPQQS